MDIAKGLNEISEIYKDLLDKAVADERRDNLRTLYKVRGEVFDSGSDLGKIQTGECIAIDKIDDLISKLTDKTEE